MKFAGKLLALIIFLVTQYGLRAAEPEIRAFIEPSVSKAGVTNRYTVEFAAPDSNYSITLPERRIIDENTKLPQYIISDIDQNSENREDLYYLTVTIQIAYFKPGKYELPAVRIIDSEGNELGYRVPTIEIIQQNTQGNFEDIEPPFKRSGNYTRMILVGLVVLLLIIILVLLWKFIQKWIAEKRAQPEKIDPAVEFFTSLNKLLKKLYLENNEIELYCTELSSIFRKYLLQQFDFPALDMTTDEIYKKVRSLHKKSKYAETIRKMMQLWDLAKFAELRPSAEILTTNLDEVKTLVKNIEKESENGL
jgi:hypothetical protein